jgi:hypothetical protein
MIQHINIRISDKGLTRDRYEQALGAEFLVRRPELNQGKSPSRIGSGNIHQDEFLYSAVQESGQMTVFGIDGVPRKLTRLATHPLVNRPGWISITELAG